MGGACGPTGSTMALTVKQGGFWGFSPFLALVETIALAVHLQDMDMVGEPVQQCAGHDVPTPNISVHFVERQVGGHQSGAALVTLAEHLEQPVRRRFY